MRSGKLYSYCGIGKIPVWDGELNQKRRFSNCIGELKPNDIIMVIDILHIERKNIQSVTQIKLLNANGVAGMVCIFSVIEESKFIEILT
jgi:hypothetical protein